jgi:scyllo-inositol 2-dehydrogenase (NADP+)
VQRSGDEAAKAYPKVRIARSIEEMLSDSSIQLVAVTTPNYLHFEMAEECLRAGRNVVIDKPFTLTVEEAHKLFDLAREHGKLATAYQNRRWDGDFTTLKEVIASGELGRVVTFESHFDRYRAQPRTHTWKESTGPGRGLLYDLSPHLIDHATQLFGDPESVFADVRTERDGALIDDAFDLQLKFPGVTALLRSSLTAYAAAPRFIVHGTRGSYVKRGIDPQEDQLKAGAKFTDAGFGEDPEKDWGELHIAGEPVRRVPTAKGDYRGYYANVRDAILGKAKIEVTPEQVLRTTRLIELARASSAEGKRMAYRAG